LLRAGSLLPHLVELLEVPADFSDDSLDTLDQDFSEPFGLVEKVNDLLKR
jgi:hypothetical protein